MPRTKCPSCGWKGEVDTELIGEQVICPECEDEFNCRALKKKQSMVVPRGSNMRAPSSGSRRCHEVDYDILGDDIQVVEVELDPGEVVIAEAGAMVYMD
jgi:hypothetical protein